MNTAGAQGIAWTGALLGATLVLLVPALWNGFPFLFYDSEAFIEQALGGAFVPERSVFYAWFLAGTGVRVSIWLPLAIQAAFCAVAMAIAARAVAPRISSGLFLAIVVALCALTALPWVAGQLLPDVFTPVLILSLYVLGFHSESLTRATRCCLAIMAIVAAVSHPSHLGLTAGLALFIAAGSHTRIFDRAVCWRWAAAITVVSILLVVASNAGRTGEIFISRAGPAFLLGRLMEDGLVQPVLDESCPDARYALCAYKDNLPRTGNDWLWHGDSPFRALGGFEGTAVEAKAIIVQSLKRDPARHAATAAAATLRQFVTFRSGDGFEPMGDGLVPIITALDPNLVAPYRAARQQQGRLDFAGVSAVHVATAAVATAGLCIILVLRGTRGRAGALPLFILAALFGNALICGTLSGVHDRYQARVVWIALFCVILIAATEFRIPLWISGFARRCLLQGPPIRPNDSGGVAKDA